MSRVVQERGRPRNGALRRALLALFGLMMVGWCISSVYLLPARAFSLSGSPVTITRLEAAAIDPTSLVGCHYGPTRPVGDVRTKVIREASGRVASQQWPGIYWTINDAHNEAALFAFDEQGHPQGTFRVDHARNVDWEALQLGPDRDGGWALYIGDIGDNDGKRREVMIHRVPEPRPMSAGTRTATSWTNRADTFRFGFPDGPRNAEAMLVHPKTGEILVITKDPSGKSDVFRMPMPLDSRHTVTLEWVAELNVGTLDPSGSVVTDASVSPDGRRVTVRTYGSALEYDLPDGAPLTGIWKQAPRVARLDDGPKGEGITYRADGWALMTIGENSIATLFQTALEC